ncbi:hypothetical protein HanIR_Chr16g0826211 [Helianthus annuus]|nr:hypothetical protein HanIR_Chr16g0826211 [Helianthus annuus]
MFQFFFSFYRFDIPKDEFKFYKVSIRKVEYFFMYICSLQWQFFHKRIHAIFKYFSNWILSLILWNKRNKNFDLDTRLLNSDFFIWTLEQLGISFDLYIQNHIL